jgi:hypothetical protein
MSDPAVSGLPESWVAYITPFAATLGLTVEEVTAKLQPVVGVPGDQAIELLKNPALSPDSDIKVVLNGTPVAVANKAISQLREQVATSAATMAVMGSGILPDVPNDESLLTALRTGGVRKVEPSTVQAAVRTALANRVGLYDVPDLLVRLIENFAEQNDDPAPPEFYKIRKEITRRTYGDLFEAIEGFDASYVTDGRRNALFDRIDRFMWPAIISFQAQLCGWMDAWQKQGLNPLMLNAVMMRAAGIGGSMPPTAQAPDTGVLRDAALSFNDQVNKVFAGPGIQVAAALAADAIRIKETLLNPRIPPLVGAANRDQMLKMLGVDVTPQYPRMETNLVKYVVAIMNVEQVAAGEEELNYFAALFTLGTQIPWADLEKGKRAPRAAAPSAPRRSGDSW